MPTQGELRTVWGKSVKLLAIPVFLIIGFHSIGWADDRGDFKDGMKAYQDRDFPKALRLWRALADKGHINAQYNLGILYFQGAGVTKDRKKALELFQKSAKQGFSDAQYHLGLMYLNGEGVTQSDKEAVKWFREAAEQGDDLAQYSLAAMYLYGKGVKKDLVKAHMWSNLAARQGNKDAEKARDQIAHNMTPEEIINARLMAREWKPKGKKKEE